MSIKFATFNVENLFTRPRAMNLANQDLGTEKLKIIAELQDELAKTTYNKQKIVNLANKVHGYFMINKTRGKNPLSRNRRQGTYKVPASVRGRGDWEGFIDLKRDRFDSLSVKNTARFIRGLNADVLGICEVENLDTMRYFRTDRLSREGLNYELLIDGNDPRGIDVGIYSQHPFGWIRTNIHHKPSPSARRTFSRDCLEAEVLLPSGASLWVLQNHLKSKLGPAASGNARRKSQTQRISEILDEGYDLSRDFVVVAGDMNDTPDSDPLSPLTERDDLKDVLDVARVPAAKRWTYEFRGQFNQIDYVLVSQALASKVAAAGVDRRGIAELEDLTNGDEKPLRGITNWRNAASDHGAVWAEFNI